MLKNYFNGFVAKFPILGLGIMVYKKKMLGAGLLSYRKIMLSICKKNLFSPASKISQKVIKCIHLLVSNCNVQSKNETLRLCVKEGTFGHH